MVDDASNTDDKEQEKSSKPRGLQHWPTIRLAVPITFIVMACCAIAFFRAGQHHAVRPNDVQSQNWEVRGGIKQGNEGQLTVGNGNKVNMNHEDTFTNQTVEGKRCEGSGNTAEGVGAAQTVCCYGSNVQCCGEAAVVHASAKAVKQCEESGMHRCQQAVVDTKCTRVSVLQRAVWSAHDVKQGDRGILTVGNGNHITINEGNRRIIERAMRKLVTELKHPSHLLEVTACIQTITVLKCSAILVSPIGEHMATPIDICQEAGNLGGCALLCKEDVVLRKSQTVCEGVQYMYIYI